jgi:hypothetical protein
LILGLLELLDQDADLLLELIHRRLRIGDVPPVAFQLPLHDLARPGLCQLLADLQVQELSVHPIHVVPDDGELAV